MYSAVPLYRSTSDQSPLCFFWLNNINFIVDAFSQLSEQKTSAVK